MNKQTLKEEILNEVDYILDSNCPPTSVQYSDSKYKNLRTRDVLKGLIRTALDRVAKGAREEEKVVAGDTNVIHKPAAVLSGVNEWQEKLTNWISDAEWDSYKGKPVSIANLIAFFENVLLSHDNQLREKIKALPDQGDVSDIDTGEIIDVLISRDGVLELIDGGTK